MFGHSFKFIFPVKDDAFRWILTEPEMCGFVEQHGRAAFVQFCQRGLHLLLNFWLKYIAYLFATGKF